MAQAIEEESRPRRRRRLRPGATARTGTRASPAAGWSWWWSLPWCSWSLPWCWWSLRGAGGRSSGAGGRGRRAGGRSRGAGGRGRRAGRGRGDQRRGVRHWCQTAEDEPGAPVRRRVADPDGARVGGRRGVELAGPGFGSLPSSQVTVELGSKPFGFVLETSSTSGAVPSLPVGRTYRFISIVALPSALGVMVVEVPGSYCWIVSPSQLDCFVGLALHSSHFNGVPGVRTVSPKGC